VPGLYRKQNHNGRTLIAIDSECVLTPDVLLRVREESPWSRFILSGWACYCPSRSRPSRPYAFRGGMRAAILWFAIRSHELLSDRMRRRSPCVAISTLAPSLVGCHDSAGQPHITFSLQLVLHAAIRHLASKGHLWFLRLVPRLGRRARSVKTTQRAGDSEASLPVRAELRDNAATFANMLPSLKSPMRRVGLIILRLRPVAANGILAPLAVLHGRPEQHS
jgi:hypothetical protein